MIDFTPIVRGRFIRQAGRMERWSGRTAHVQAAELRRLLLRAAGTETGRRYSFAGMARMDDGAMAAQYASSVPVAVYGDIRPDVMRMMRGDRDLLWPGRCRNFAQSSGTSDGKSKYLPVTDESLRYNHFAGASDAVAAYLRLNPGSRLFSGRALILGGSFANELGGSLPSGTRVGDLSATLISRTPWPASMFRTPKRDIALMADWEEKLPAMARAAARANITNLSGVPSWFLVLLRKVLEQTGAPTLQDIWPSLEVFFHGGISFKPYRRQYEAFTQPDKMHFLETYNASEGFFAVQTDFSDPALQLLLDRGVYYEFAPLGPDGHFGTPVGIADTVRGQTYALIITACNGLWRYSLGDTVRMEDPDRGRITIAGRTKSFINAFGEELMEHNAEEGIAGACNLTGARVANYTAAPVYASGGQRGRHRWLIEWDKAPDDNAAFASALDRGLQQANSDYQAKRAGNIFLDPPEVVSAPSGTFDRWLLTHGSGKLGGQRKVPRLCPTPEIMDQLLDMCRHT